MSDIEGFEKTDAGASAVIPMEAGQIRKGGYIVIKNRPCKVVSVSTSKTGKHGHAKCNFVATDIFTGKKLEDIVPSTHGTTVYVGVALGPARDLPYRATIKLDGIKTCLGSFATAEEAALEIAKTRRRLGLQSRLRSGRFGKEAVRAAALTPEEAEATATSEGLVLQRSTRSATGFLNVHKYAGRGGMAVRSEWPYRANHATGRWATAEEAALNEARAMAGRVPPAKRARPRYVEDETSDEEGSDEEGSEAEEEEEEGGHSAFDDDDGSERDGSEREASPLHVVAYDDDEEDDEDEEDEDEDEEDDEDDEYEDEDAENDDVDAAVAEPWREGSVEDSAVAVVEVEAVAAEDVEEADDFAGACSVVAVQCVQVECQD